MLSILLPDKFKGATPLSSSYLLGARHLQPSCTPTSLQARCCATHTARTAMAAAVQTILKAATQLLVRGNLQEAKPHPAVPTTLCQSRRCTRRDGGSRGYHAYANGIALEQQQGLGEGQHAFDAQTPSTACTLAAACALRSARQLAGPAATAEQQGLQEPTYMCCSGKAHKPASQCCQNPL
jgi:hypothetical protein